MKIKEASARERARQDDPRPGAFNLRLSEDRALLLAAVPDLIQEIERLKKSAKDGWNHLAEMADNEGYLQELAIAVDALKDIEDPS